MRAAICARWKPSLSTASTRRTSASIMQAERIWGSTVPRRKRRWRAARSIPPRRSGPPPAAPSCSRCPMAASSSRTATPISAAACRCGPCAATRNRRAASVPAMAGAVLRHRPVDSTRAQPHNGPHHAQHQPASLRPDRRRRQRPFDDANGRAGHGPPGRPRHQRRVAVAGPPHVQVWRAGDGCRRTAGRQDEIAPGPPLVLGLLARVLSAGIAGAALAPKGREKAGAAVAVATAVPLAYLTLAGRKKAMAEMGQTKSGLIEDALIVAAGAAVVALATQR